MTVVDRANELIERSDYLRENDKGKKPESETNGLLLDGSGSSCDPTKTFLRPLSKGATVMLRRMIQELEYLAENR